MGYTTPREFMQLIEGLRANVKGIDGVTISVHGHDDLGMAVANFLAAIEGGARQVSNEGVRVNLSEGTSGQQGGSEGELM